jgi:hypothetical protein
MINGHIGSKWSGANLTKRACSRAKHATILHETMQAKNFERGHRFTHDCSVYMHLPFQDHNLYDHMHSAAGSDLDP